MQYLDVVSIILPLCGMSATGSLEKDGSLSEGDFEYTVKNRKATITKYTGNDDKLIISEKLGNYEVSSIGERAFMNYISLTEVEIPDSVIIIEEWAFAHSYGLTSIKIPDSVTSIGDYAFYACESLTAIEIPDSVTSIGDTAFTACESLSEIEIPDSVTSIGGGAFLNRAS